VADLAIYISGTAALSAVGLAIRVTWLLSRIEKDVRSDAAKGDRELGEAMDAQIDNLRRDLGKSETHQAQRVEQLRQETGEMGNAIRQKLHDIEVFCRDHFVSKDSFESVIDRFERTVEKMTDRLETKFDKAVDRFHQRPD
jgi:ribosome recycling factor